MPTGNGSRSDYSPLKAGSPAPLHNPLHSSYHIPYPERSFADNTSILEWVVTQAPSVHGIEARGMFDSLNVDEKKDPHGVASRIVEIMSCEENICMLDITAKPSDAKVDGIPSELTKEILPQVTTVT